MNEEWLLNEVEYDGDENRRNKCALVIEISSIIWLEDIGSYFGKGLNLGCNEVKIKHGLWG